MDADFWNDKFELIVIWAKNIAEFTSLFVGGLNCIIGKK